MTFLVLLSTGCASTTSPLSGIISAVVSDAIGPGQATNIPAQPDPAYRYLRVEIVGSSPALLVLGYIDAHPQGEIEVWYSAQSEVIKTQNGRIVGTAGLQTDWRAVQFVTAPPVWPDVVPPLNEFSRVRNVMPGHRFAIAERVQVEPWLGVPPISFSKTLLAEQARSYRWFRETARVANAQALPPSWFAWGQHRGQATIVYSEQCLAVNFCLRLQRWPVQEGAL